MVVPTVPRWLPNAISCLRILLVPVWIACAELANAAPADAAFHRRLATLVLLTIGFSDIVDGWLARRFQLHSRAGAILDAVADKLAQVVLTTYLALAAGTAFPPIPLWFLGLLIARDGLLLLGFAVIRRRAHSVDTEHEWHGKLASLGLFAMLVVHSSGLDGFFADALLVATTALVVVSTAGYVRRGIGQLQATPGAPSPSREP